jgi:DNA mismatch repair protein MutS2
MSNETDQFDDPSGEDEVPAEDYGLSGGLDHALEWSRFLSLAIPEARTQPGKDLIDDLAEPRFWATDIAQARLLQQETQEVLPLLDRDALWGPLTDLLDPSEIVERLQRGAVLEIQELVVLRGWLYALDSWSQIPRDEIREGYFKKALLSLTDPSQPLRVLDRILTPEGELSEKASPKLASLYSEIRGLKREISIVLDGLMKTLSSKGVLQENFSDVRDGRFVLPVKISSQNEVDGIIYEASASRQTVFVEPKEVAVLNNRLRQRQNDLVQEIFIILEDTSKKIAPFAAELFESFEIIAYWDCVHAKARFGRNYSGKSIEVTENRVFILHQTAHPLLWWALKPADIIRNELEFGDPSRTLLITGPNTGGKTVLLKTLGLAGICARTGFPFPGTDHPSVPFFDQFFADLGDSQSIEQHLSTFAGHVARFKDILENVTENSLVLMDELNSATDPEEGAALGRAFLETVMAKGALIVATTHDPHLKAMAVSDSRILNSSMEFDEHARIPTYKMVSGVPGRSRALETAERLGVPAHVLELARKYLSREHNEFEKMLAQLEHDVQEAARARREAVHIREEAEKIKKEWTQRTETSVSEMLEKTRQKLRRVLEQAQDDVRASVRKLDELKNRKEVDSERSKINETFGVATSRLESALAEEAPDLAEALAKSEKLKIAEAAPKAKIEVGTLVRIPKWKNTGKILEIKGDKVKVEMGKIQMSLSMDDVDVLTASEAAVVRATQPKPGKTRSYESASVAAPAPQIDLRGMRFDDAMSELERYLDQAFRSNAMVEVTIVHGLGTGAIREGTRKLIAKLPYIKNYRDSGLGQGGAGATLVEFDR